MSKARLPFHVSISGCVPLGNEDIKTEQSQLTSKVLEIYNSQA